MRLILKVTVRMNDEPVYSKLFTISGYAAEVAVMSGLSTFGPTLVVGLGVINNEV